LGRSISGGYHRWDHGLFSDHFALAELKKTELAPRETVESIKEDAQWLRDQVT
jgi:hypothetical protein